jgi:GntR family transcriptional regulator/MocR family aminotransferase
MLEISPKLDTTSPTPLYIQIYEYMKNEILLNQISPGTKVPSIRCLASYLCVSKNTINTAYQQLISEGYLKSNGRSGLFVEAINSDFFRLDSNPSLKNQTKIFLKEDHKVLYDFSNGQIDQQSFPFNQFRSILSQCIDLCHSELLLYGDHQGDYSFLTKISEYLHQSRGVLCSPYEIILGSGTQQSLSLLCMLLKKHYPSIGFENPGYVGARAVFEHHDFKIEPIPLEYDGISIDALYESGVKIVYVTPSHQFPAGMVMSISKRLKLLQWAEEVDGIIIEDDYDGEFRYKGKPIPALQGLDNNKRVVYLGTFSKSLMPSIRISYQILPPKLLNLYKENLSIYEQPVPRIIQKTLEVFMDKGYWDKHIRRCRVLYKRKHELLLQAIKDLLDDKVKIIGEDSGLHILLQVKTELTESELIQKALECGVKVNSTSSYWIGKSTESFPTFPVIFIGFAGIKSEEIYDAIRKLKKAWF